MTSLPETQQVYFQYYHYSPKKFCGGLPFFFFPKVSSSRSDQAAVFLSALPRRSRRETASAAVRDVSERVPSEALCLLRLSFPFKLAHFSHPQCGARPWPQTAEPRRPKRKCGPQQRRGLSPSGPHYAHIHLGADHLCPRRHAGPLAVWPRFGAFGTATGGAA